MLNQEAFKHYLTGVPDMDNDHFDLVMSMNEVQRLYTQGESVRAMELLQKLKVSTKDHFSREEVWMREIGFKFVEYHTQLHREFIFKFEKFISLCVVNLFIPNIDDNLIQPFRVHLECDRLYSEPYQEWLAKNGRNKE